MFAVGKLDIFASQNRYNSVSQNFDMLPNGNKFDINSCAPQRISLRKAEYRAPQRISQIPQGIYIAESMQLQNNLFDLPVDLLQNRVQSVAYKRNKLLNGVFIEDACDQAKAKDNGHQYDHPNQNVFISKVIIYIVPH